MLDLYVTLFPIYVLFRKDRVDNNCRHGSTHHGGVILYIKSNLNVSQVDLRNVESPYNENIWVQIGIPFTRPIYVGVTYIHEVRLESFDNVNSMLEKIKDPCSCHRTPAEIVCLGDFNCDNFKTTSWEWKKLKKLMSNLNLCQMITEATRTTKNSSTLIDHFWTNRSEMYNDCGILPFLSDHSLVYVVR